MKLYYLLPAIIISAVFSSCENQNQKQVNKPSTLNTAPEVTMDNRPKEEVSFLNRVKAESDYDVTSNAAKKDSHILAFNKYAMDSLKKIVNWEMIVTDVNDSKVAANSFASNVLDLYNNDCYNLVLVAPIKINKSVDTIAIDNRVDFTYTILKNAKGDSLKKQLSLIKTLTKGDTVIVSGALTHLDNDMKVNFSSFYDQYGAWNLDLLLLDIHKKGTK